MPAAGFDIAIPTDQPFKIFQADVFGILPDFLFPLVSLGHVDMLPYMVALFKHNNLNYVVAAIVSDTVLSPPHFPNQIFCVTILSR
jgi:hypothetical protein